MRFDLLNLATTLSVEGEVFQVNTSFLNWLRFECLILSAKKEEATKLALSLVSGNVTASNAEAVLDKLVDFYIGEPGEKESEGSQSGSEKSERDYDYRVDMGRVYAAFTECYGINLLEEDMHWWAFMNLLESLAESTHFVKVRGYRSMNLKGLKGEELKRAQRLKKAYALPSGAKVDAKKTQEDYYDFIQNKLKQTGIKLVDDGI